MAYTKPVVLAQNSAQGVFAAGCPEKGKGTGSQCKDCERSL
jgi:L-asparaginase II